MKGRGGRCFVVSLLFYFMVVYSTFRVQMVKQCFAQENIGVVFILDIKTQFFTIKVLGIDDEGLGSCQ